MIILRQREFATTGKALEKKTKKLIDEYGLSRADALEVIRKRDQIAVELNKTRNEINNTPIQLDERLNPELKKTLEKAEKDTARIKAIDNADIKYLDTIKDQQKKRHDILINAYDRHASRDISGKDLLIKAKYAKRNAKNWIKKNPGKTAAGVLGTAGLAYGGKKLYDHYKENKDKEE